MKKVLFAAVAVLAFGFANAQKSVRFGVKAGLNVATITGDYYTNSEPRLGVHAGGLLDIKLTNRFSIQPELLLSLQGTKFDRTFRNGDFRTEYTRNLAYINVPVMAKFYVLPKLSLEAGPQLGFLVAAKDKVSGTEFNNDGSVSTASRTTDVKGDFATIDAGVNFGLSYYFTDNFFAQGRYSLGLSSIDDRSYNYNDNTNEFESYSDFNAQNSVLQFSVGYRF